MTPEQIVEMIGNISNRADLKAIQTNQVFYIKGLIRDAEARGMERAAKIAAFNGPEECDCQDKIRADAAKESNK